MAFIPIAMAVAGAAVSAYGAIQQGKTQSANYKAQSQADLTNAQINTQNANTAGALASSRELQLRSRQAQELGNIRAGMAESGGEGGTNAGVLRQDETNMELDALNTRYQGILQSRGYNIQSSEDVFQSKVAGVNAGAARTGSYFSAASSLLSGASRAYGMGGGY